MTCRVQSSGKCSSGDGRTGLEITEDHVVMAAISSNAGKGIRQALWDGPVPGRRGSAPRARVAWPPTALAMRATSCATSSRALVPEGRLVARRDVKSRRYFSLARQTTNPGERKLADFGPFRREPPGSGRLQWSALREHHQRSRNKKKAAPFFLALTEQCEFEVRVLDSLLDSDRRSRAIGTARTGHQPFRLSKAENRRGAARARPCFTFAPPDGRARRTDDARRHPLPPR